MTITTTAVRNDFVSSGQTTFTYTFKIFAATDIVVSVNGVVKTLTTDYTVTGVGNATGGTIIFNTATTTGSAISLTRVLPFVRSADYQPSGQFASQTVNTEFDRVWAKAQELNAAETRSIQLAPSDPVAATLTLPLSTVRANGVLSFDAAGNVTVTSGSGLYRGTWATGTAYNVRDIVKDGAAGGNTGSIYYAALSHTSGSWAADLAAGNWSLVIDGSIVAAAANSAAAALASQTAAHTSENNAASSASTATTQATTAITQAGIATTQATTATTQAGIATTQASNASNSATAANNSATSAAASAAGASGGVKASPTDTTVGVLNAKLIAGTDLTLTLNNGGSNESLTLAANGNIARLATAQTFTASQTFSAKTIISGAALNEAGIATLASASTTDIGNAASNWISITGTTTITSLGTAINGARRHVTFAGALTLTYNASTLVLPGAANITTTAGDTATFISNPSGWVCISYQKVSGASVASTVFPTIMVQDRKTNGTAGSALGGTTWSDHDCQTISANTITGASVSNPNVTLPAGVYDVYAWCGWVLGSGTATTRLRLYNTTAGAVQTDYNGLDIVSMSSCNSLGGAGGGWNVGPLRGRFTLASSNSVKFQQYASTSSCTMGTAQSSGEPEIYLQAEFVKVA